MDTINIDIIEDSSIVANLIKYELEKTDGFKVEIFASGEEYLQSSHSSDIIILDYHLDADNRQALNGLDIVRELTGNGSMAQVIFFSGQRKPEIEEEIFSSGAVAYVSKDSDDFIDEINHTVRRVANSIDHTLRERLYDSTQQRINLSLLLCIVAIISLLAMILFGT